MNGKKAKALRKRVYGDNSLKQTKEYDFFTIVKRFFTGKTNDKGEKEITNVNKTTLVCKGLRRSYLDLKNSYKKGEIRI